MISQISTPCMIARMANDCGGGRCQRFCLDECHDVDGTSHRNAHRDECRSPSSARLRETHQGWLAGLFTRHVYDRILLAKLISLHAETT